MANTTNFGWETPDDTDLVKDGALAIRTLGSAIDTSLVDLKGGTTGQILAKNSNTDMDFVWVANDQGDITEVVAGTGLSGGGTSGSVTLTNTVATAYDAKGDLIVGTGADTFAKRTVGTNEHRLVADSAETTGLKYVADTTNYAIGAKGDLLVGTAADTVTNVAVGTNGHVLTADSSTASGVKWAASTSTSGLTLVKTQTIGSAVTSVTVTDAFSSTYDNYKIIVTGGTASNTPVGLALRLGAATTGYYAFQVYGNYANNTVNGAGISNGSSFSSVGSAGPDGISCDVTLLSPNLAKRTHYISHGQQPSTTGDAIWGHGYLANNTQYTEFTLIMNNGNLTGGTIRVYGYQNS